MRSLQPTSGCRSGSITRSQLLRIGIDLMGSDSSPSVLFKAVIQAANLLGSSSSLVLFATQEVVDTLSQVYQTELSSPNSAGIIFHIVTEEITHWDEPLYAVRHKKKSSLILGIRLLKKHSIDAFVTSGNTGALIAASTLMLRMIPGIDRPGLLAVLPSKKGRLAVLDIGGNVACKAKHLMQFAQLGAAFQRCNYLVQKPRVGLLNIGVESKKGTSELRQAYQLISENSRAPNSGMEFVGNIEAREVFKGEIDVLVTDGFTGNVLLKTTEGISSFIFQSLLEAFQGNSPETFMHSFEGMRSYFNYDEYPGAILCGVNGIVVKCHGNASTKAMYNGIMGAIGLVQQQFLTQIKHQLHEV